MSKSFGNLLIHFGDSTFYLDFSYLFDDFFDNFFDLGFFNLGCHYRTDYFGGGADGGGAYFWYVG